LTVVLIGLTIFALKLQPEDPTLQDTQPSIGTTEGTNAPTNDPTEPPTDAPTDAPTVPPTDAPTVPPTDAPTEPPTQPPTAPPTQPPTEAPTQPPIEIPTGPTVPPQSTASIGSVGDILMHMGVVNSGEQSDGSYVFDNIFTQVKKLVKKFDYAVANLETTLAGPDYVHYTGDVGYSGFPGFNTPDEIVDGLKNAGFDMILTANNHSYDTRHQGFVRTQQVMLDKGMDYTGTILNTGDKNYIIKELNGVKVGMICYTYSTSNSDDKVEVNDIPMRDDSKLINAFSYSDLSAFYSRLQGQMDEMKDAGAEATVIFIHWGTEYQTSPNSSQKKIAQKLCDMGFDAIVGNHPHMVQPVQLLENSKDSSKKTVCIYSLGNAVSNQRLGNISSVSTAHTEDGALFGITFAKYADGTVILQEVELTPIWVNLYKENGKRVYEIVPLDKSISDWKGTFNMTTDQYNQAKASYDRTMDIVGEGLAQVQAWCIANQQAVAASLGGN
jgi:poly-gamma-glutamate synthesis protein (capsule biosynthesis protein)